MRAMNASGNLPQLADAALLLRILGPLVAALLAAFVFDRMCERRGLQPPGFRVPWRRGLAFALVSGVLWVGIFRPLGEIGLDLTFDPKQITTPQLFVLHGLMALSVLGWFWLGFAGAPAGVGRNGGLSPALPMPSLAAPGPSDLALAAPAGAAPPPSPDSTSTPPALAPRGERPGFLRQLAAQLGFRTPDLGREIGIGLLLGVGAWGVVVVALIILAVVVWALHGESALPKEPPALVPWIAALPVGVRVAVSLSAGFVEETFFRGFLQPRMGIALSTLMFVLAHLSYGQPFMLVGITLLSLIYAFLVRWRQTVWPAITAHALFDGVQLLVIIPFALRLLGRSEAAKALALLGF
jgi:membrane protease YdiL (CAAX protease family)